MAFSNIFEQNWIKKVKKSMHICSGKTFWNNLIVQNINNIQVSYKHNIIWSSQLYQISYA